MTTSRLEEARRETIQAGVLAAYAAAKRGLTQGGTLNVFIGELEYLGILRHFDPDVLRTQVEAGYALHFNNPQLTSEQVWELAFDAFVLMRLPGGGSMNIYRHLCPQAPTALCRDITM
jgi:hypothetical protein